MIGNIAAALKVPGWMWEYELQWLADQATKYNKIVEIGSWRGRSTRALADNTPGTVTAVDGFVGSPFDTPNGMWPDMKAQLAGKPEDWVYNEFMQNTGYLPNVRTFRMLSLDGAEHLKDEQFDMIFIDAGHDYEHVKQDILAWRPLLASGGCFSGHDYFPGCPGVMQAVDELVPNFKKGGGSIWYVEG